MTVKTPSPVTSPGPHARELSAKPGNDQKSPQIAHTLTACSRCRHRKTRCDTGLPRCGPCERTNSVCEYFDQAKGTKIPRHYVVHLQHKVRELEAQLESLEKEDYEPDVEDLVRPGATVRIQEHEESKFLGPSSGIAITRLVMQLAKRFTESESISDIVDSTKQQEIKESFAQEEAKPSSKLYPIISNIAAPDLPVREVTDQLVRLFNAKVMAMYPFFHEPTFWKDVDDVYAKSKDPFQNFAVRMVIAISLQRLETNFAGLADSFYLAALRFLEDAIKPMNVKTIQCFLLIGAYSLLTPTRTAVYYVIGLATRLTQALGLCEEKTIVQGYNGQPATFLEMDMRRRLFWSVMVMEFGLAHSMGRASCFATGQEHFDVKWFEVVDDEYITKDSKSPNAPRSLKKWISIHFFKMRLLQLEIRRKLYQTKRPEPRDENDPWFKQMEDKLNKWRDETPDTDAGSGLDAAWFQGRYNTMIVFMFRPSPQCPRPSLKAAMRCFPACKYNIYMHDDQIKRGNVDMTWIFTQAMFMNVNTILWTLSYEEIRLKYGREEVRGHLKVALDCIRIASERWPGVLSALELYHTLIEACMHIYDKKGDIEISVASPADTSGWDSRSNTTSPVTSQSQPFAPPTLTASRSHQDNTPFGQMGPLTFSPSPGTSPNAQRPSHQSNSSFSTSFHHPSDASSQNMGSLTAPSDVTTATLFTTASSFDPTGPQLALPATYPQLNLWNPDFDFTSAAPAATVPALERYEQTVPPPFSSSPSTSRHLEVTSNTGGAFVPLSPSNVPWTDYLYPPSAGVTEENFGLTQEQQVELMDSLSGPAMGTIQHILDATNRVFYPSGRQPI